MKLSAPSPSVLAPDVRVERIIARLNIGGPAIHTILLTRHLREMGFPSELVTGVEAEGEGNMLSLAEANGVNPVTFPSLGRELSPLNDLKVVFALYRRFRRVRPDVVHTHTAKAGAVGRLAAWLAQVPVRIHTFHGHVFHGYFSDRKTAFFVRLEKLLARMSTRIIVLGDRQKQDILGRGIGRDEQFVVVPLGLDLSSFLDADIHRGQLRSELHLSPDDPVAGIVARLVPIKAHEVFLEAAVRVRKIIPTAEFLIVGDGSERESLQRRVDELGARDFVRFLGFRSDLARVYADCTATVLSSDNEGMPVALIESLASATPVVATDVGETREIVEDGVTGMVVPVRNPQALAEALTALLSDPERVRQMGIAGRESVYPRLSIERLARDLAQLYRDLVQDYRNGDNKYC